MLPEATLQGEGSGIGLIKLLISKVFCVFCVYSYEAVFLFSRLRRL